MTKLLWLRKGNAATRALLLLLLIIFVCTNHAEAQTVANLLPNGADIKWYAAPTGGTPLPSNTVITDGTHYYASQTVNGCESTDRQDVLANVIPRPTPTFTDQPGGTATINTDVTYTTESGKSDYAWTHSGVLSTDYSITSGGGNTNSVTLKWLTAGSKTVTVNYTENGCAAATATSSMATSVTTIPTMAATTTVTSITATTASSGGNITSNGGATVSASGVCWSTTSGPTIGDSKTTDGSATGTFTSSMVGLTASTTYYVRAYATNSLGTGYGAEVSFTTSSPPLPSVGDSYQGGVLAYFLAPGDPGYNASLPHGLIAATADIGNSFWGCQLSGSELTGADGMAIGTGYQNTLDIVAGCATAGIAAKLCNDLVSGGYSDWYLPSKNELYKLYLNRAAIGGFGTAEYWTSTEDGGWNAFVVNFSTGNMTGKAKEDSPKPSRAIRAF